MQKFGRNPACLASSFTMRSPSAWKVESGTFEPRGPNRMQSLRRQVNDLVASAAEE